MSTYIRILVAMGLLLTPLAAVPSSEKPPQIEVSVAIVEFIGTENLPPSDPEELATWLKKWRGQPPCPLSTLFHAVPGCDVLASPTMVIVSGSRPGKLSVGQTMYFDGTSATTKAPEQHPNPDSLEKVFIGVTMEASGEVLDNGLLKIQVHPVVSDFEGFIETEEPGPEGQSVNHFKPIVQTTGSNSSVILKSGEIVQIMGQRSSTKTVSEDGTEESTSKGTYAFLTAQLLPE